MQTSNNPLNAFVQSFKEPIEEQPTIANSVQTPWLSQKGTLDKNWQNIKQGITNSALGIATQEEVE